MEMLCTILFTRWGVSESSLVRFLILLNSWIKIVHAHFPWSNLYFLWLYSKIPVVGMDYSYIYTCYFSIKLHLIYLCLLASAWKRKWMPFFATLKGMILFLHKVSTEFMNFSMVGALTSSVWYNVKECVQFCSFVVRWNHQSRTHKKLFRCTPLLGQPSYRLHQTTLCF